MVEVYFRDGGSDEIRQQAQLLYQIEACGLVFIDLLGIP
jgi:hypothetical protein